MRTSSIHRFLAALRFLWFSSWLFISLSILIHLSSNLFPHLHYSWIYILSLSASVYSTFPFLLHILWHYKTLLHFPHIFLSPLLVFFTSLASFSCASSSKLSHPLPPSSLCLTLENPSSLYISTSFNPSQPSLDRLFLMTSLHLFYINFPLMSSYSNCPYSVIPQPYSSFFHSFWYSFRTFPCKCFIF